MPFRPSLLPSSIALALALVMPAAAVAQPTPAAAAAVGRTFTFAEALDFAVAHYPSVRAAAEAVQASTAGVALARTASLPRLDVVWQVNRATVNNVTGVLLPQSVVPSLSGPPGAVASSGSVWGQAAGALASWEPFDFGLRDAGVRSAEAAVTQARAGERLTRLDVQHVVGAAFLAVMQADLAVVAAEADVERRTVLARTARTLADNQLRPGAEASRADAERAAADTRAILARQQRVLAQATLARLLGVEGGLAGVNAAGLLAAAPPPSPATDTTAGHPLLAVGQASVDAARAQEEVLADVYRPRLFVQSAAFARGSGAAYNGALDGGASGLGFDRANWAAGVQVVLPNLFDLPGVRARRAAAAARTRIEDAHQAEARLLVQSQQQAAAALVAAARAVAANTPVQLAAARLSETQATARYQAGLTTLVEVAEAQNLLAQAEAQDALARVEVWRALLEDAAARGDIEPLARASGGSLAEPR